MNSALLVNIVLYGVIIVMMFNILQTSKRQKKRKDLIDLVNMIKDPEFFFQKGDEVLEKYKDDPEILNKARVVMLWGISYHKQYEKFRDMLASIDMNPLIENKKNGLSIDLNEDSFFYMYLGIPNILYQDKQDELRDLLKEKMQEFDEKLTGQLVREISLEINKYYTNEDDRGLVFYEKVLDGNYGQYTYSKTMIGLYKSIVNAMAARIYLDNGETEKYQAAEGMVKDFDESGVGHRWLQSLDIHFATPSEDELDQNAEDNDKETFEITNESAKKADVIDAEVVKEEEKKEDQE